MNIESLLKLGFNFGVPTAILFFILWRADKHASKLIHHIAVMNHEMTMIRVLIDTIAAKLEVKK